MSWENTPVPRVEVTRYSRWCCPSCCCPRTMTHTSGLTQAWNTPATSMSMRSPSSKPAPRTRCHAASTCSRRSCRVVPISGNSNGCQLRGNCSASTTTPTSVVCNAKDSNATPRRYWKPSRVECLRHVYPGGVCHHMMPGWWTFGPHVAYLQGPTGTAVCGIITSEAVPITQKLGCMSQDGRVAVCDSYTLWLRMVHRRSKLPANLSGTVTVRARPLWKAGAGFSRTPDVTPKVQAVLWPTQRQANLSGAYDRGGVPQCG